MKRILWVVLLIAAALYICGPLVDPDLWWHITIGRWIVAHHQIPHRDHWTMFAYGIPWRAYSWSSEVIFSLVEQQFSLHGLLMLKGGVAVALALSLGWIYSRLSKDYIFGALVGAYATVATFNHFTLRPQSIIWILFAWLIYFAERYRVHPEKRVLVALTLIMSLWANTHLSSILGVMLAAVWVYSSSNRAKSIWAGLAAFIGTLITPYFGGEWLTFITKADHPFTHASIAEFQAASINQYSTAFLLLLGALLLLLLHRRPKALALPQLLLFGLFSFGGLAVVKFLPFAVILGGATLALFWSHECGQLGAAGELAVGLGKLREVVARVSTSRPLAMLALAMLLLSSFSNFRAASHTLISRDFVAVQPLDFIQSQNLPLPLLNAFGDGGYVLYRYAKSDGEAGYRVPIDGRTNVTPPDIQEKHGEAFTGTLKWRDYVDAVKPQTVLWRNASPLTAILAATSEWCLVYRNESLSQGHAVFVRKAWWIEQKPHLPSENCMEAGDEKFVPSKG